MALPQFSFRPIESEADYLALISVREKCLPIDESDIDSPEETFPTISTLSLSYPLSDHFSRLPTLILVQNVGEVIGYQTIFWWHHHEGYSYGHRGYLAPLWH